MAVVKKTVAPVAAKVEAPKAEVKKAAPTTPVKIREVKHDIARVKTVLAELAASDQQ